MHDEITKKSPKSEMLGATQHHQPYIPQTSKLELDTQLDFFITPFAQAPMIGNNPFGGKRVKRGVHQVIRPIGAEGLDRRGPAGSCRLFLGPGFRLGACWNRLVETVKTRKKRGKTGKKWARYSLKRVKEGG